MSFLTAVLLGLVQGITEFLPVSSSGHLALLQNFFHIEEADMLFDVLLHVGSLFAIFASYRKDIAGAMRGGLGLLGIGRDRGRTNKRNLERRRLFLLLILGTLPLPLAFFLKDFAAGLYQKPVLVSLLLLVNGGILFVADRNARGGRLLQDAGFSHALLIGVSQVAAVLPGVSRSGVTISAGLLCGFRRSFAVRFSFLLSIPAVLGAALVSLVDATQAGASFGALPVYLGGMLAAAVSGYFSIRLLRYLAAQRNFGGFAYYCWGAGIVSLILSLIA